MKIRGKLKIIIIGIVCMILLTTACQKPERVTTLNHPIVRVGTLKGPTGMGMVRLMDQSEKGETALDYTFEILDSPDELVSKIISGEVDVAAVPTNVALLLYNKTEGKVIVTAVNTLGVLSLLENGDQIHQISDLKDKTVHVSGKGASPDFILQFLLQKAGLVINQDVELAYNLQHADLAAAMAEGDVAIGLLPQPHVTTAMIKNPNLRIAIDMTQEWEDVNQGNQLAMGVLVAQTSFAKTNQETLNLFLDEYKSSVAYVNENIEEASILVEATGILPNAAIAQKAIPLSNIIYIDANEARPFLDAYFEVLYDFEPNSIGGELADHAFYYEK
ncbi:ABC transporter substrate-binding protein [Petrocella sp. FN5]|uniref:ABC transporter substrate-binding protein n=1 Tax=Petrocella sp. FN5 TaxID=3032002 RepID=UPI0023DBD469|nr:MqnA/MqnD/SBP family protein [Petrocella sp. FN5]MDF1617205.1 ABC transporter substrate-binding protein [Petrocella sp. FN5]